MLKEALHKTYTRISVLLKPGVSAMERINIRIHSIIWILTLKKLGHKIDWAFVYMYG